MTKLQLALEIANPDIIVTELMLQHMKQWCLRNEEYGRGILQGIYAPVWKDDVLQLYKYPENLAIGIKERLKHVT